RGFEGSQSPSEQQKRPSETSRTGVRRSLRPVLLHVRQTDSHPLEIAHSAADAQRHIATKAHVNSQAEGEPHVATTAGTDYGDKRWMDVRGEGGLGVFQLEAPAHGE